MTLFLCKHYSKTLYYSNNILITVLIYGFYKGALMIVTRCLEETKLD